MARPSKAANRDKSVLTIRRDNRGCRLYAEIVDVHNGRLMVKQASMTNTMEQQPARPTNHLWLFFEIQKTLNVEAPAARSALLDPPAIRELIQVLEKHLSVMDSGPDTTSPIYEVE